MDAVKNQRGSILVFMTLMFVILFVMVGIGLDVGFMTYTRNTSQSALDAAALSAVSGLPAAQTGNSDAPVLMHALAQGAMTTPPRR